MLLCIIILTLCCGGDDYILTGKNMFGSTQWKKYLFLEETQGKIYDLLKISALSESEVMKF